MKSILLLALLFATAPTAAEDIGNRPMEVELKSGPRPAEYFTGKVTIAGQFQREAPLRVGGAMEQVTDQYYRAGPRG